MTNKKLGRIFYDEKKGRHVDTFGEVVENLAYISQFGYKVSERKLNNSELEGRVLIELEHRSEDRELSKANYFKASESKVLTLSHGFIPNSIKYLYYFELYEKRV